MKATNSDSKRMVKKEKNSNIGNMMKYVNCSRNRWRMCISFRRTLLLQQLGLGRLCWAVHRQRQRNDGCAGQCPDNEMSISRQGRGGWPRLVHDWGQKGPKKKRVRVVESRFFFFPAPFSRRGLSWMTVLLGSLQAAPFLYRRLRMCMEGRAKSKPQLLRGGLGDGWQAGVEGALLTEAG